MSYIVAPISTLVKTIILIVLPHTISYIVNEINMPQHLTLNHLFSNAEVRITPLTSSTYFPPLPPGDGSHYLN